MPVHIVKYNCGLTTIKQIQKAKPTQLILLTKRIHEVFTNLSFGVLVTNFSREPVLLHKQMWIFVSRGLVDCIVEPKRSNGLKPKVEINDLH